METEITQDLRETLLELAAKYRWKEVFQDTLTGELLNGAPVDASALYLLQSGNESGRRSSSLSPVIKTGALPGSVTKRSRRGNTRARMSLDLYLNDEELLDSPLVGCGEPATPENVLTSMFKELTVTPHVAPAFRVSTIGVFSSDDESDDDNIGERQKCDNRSETNSSMGADDGIMFASPEVDHSQTLASNLFQDESPKAVRDIASDITVTSHRTSIVKRVSIMAPPVGGDRRNSGSSNDDEGECEWTEDWLMNTPAPKPLHRSSASSDGFVLRKPFTPRQPRTYRERNSNASSDSDNSGDGSAALSDDESFQDGSSESSWHSRQEEASDGEEEEEEVEDDADEDVNARGRVEKENRPLRTPNRAGGKTPCMFEQFKRNRNALARQWFDTFNRKVFSSLLPANTAVEWSKQLRSTAGRCYPRRNGDKRVAFIELSVKVLDTEERLKSTLLHEMCHAAAWIIDSTCRPPHGTVFYKWGAIATKKFPDLPVTRCHNFVIHKPYKYRCTLCDRRFGRHTKNSIKVDTHRCRCGGRLEFEGMFKPDGTPHKPRVANGFSLFVKEHYASVKSANPGLTQADIMRKVAAAYKARDVVQTPSLIPESI